MKTKQLWGKTASGKQEQEVHAVFSLCSPSDLTALKLCERLELTAKGVRDPAELWVV